jgi:hypothetical protein
MLQRKWKDIETFLPIAAQQFCLVCYWLGYISRIFHQNHPAGTFAQRVSVLFGHFPPAFQYSFSIAQGLSKNL